MKKLVLIDGHSILNRAFYGVPSLTNSVGLHTNAVFGFLNIMFKILDEEKADYLAVAFDVNAKTFRHQKFEDYKGTRKGMPEELKEQVPLIKEVLKSMNIPIFEKEGFEADDIIGTLAKRYQSEEIEVSILSGDRDLLQLVDEHIKLRIPKTSKGKTTVTDYYPRDVFEEYQVTPKEFIDVKALMGDASDNIPGVPSIGEKTAIKIIHEYKSIENAYDHVSELKPPRASKMLEEHYEQAKLSKWLATICLDVDLSSDLEAMKIENLYTPESFQYMKRLEFKSLQKRYETGAFRMEASKEIKFSCVDTMEAAKAVMQKVLQSQDIGVGVCLAKQSNPFDEHLVDGLGAVSLSINQEEVFVLISGGEIDSSWIEEQVKELFCLKNIFIFDVKPLLKVMGTQRRKNVFDLSIAAYLINPLKDSYQAEDVARDLLNQIIPSRQDLLEKKDVWEELKERNSSAIEYLGWMANIAYMSRKTLLEEIKTGGMESLYFEIEMPLVYVLAEMEIAGIGVDRERLRAYGEKLSALIENVEREIYAETGEEFNINSPKQLGEILFEKMEIPGGKKTKMGYSTAADVLEKLAPDYSVIKKILSYRQLTKLYSTYVKGLIGYIEDDGRIHGIFHQTVTATGRLSSAEPNLQNIPVRTEMGSRLRDIFVPAKGCVFVDADYSQIELRILASMSGDEKLIESYRQSMDIHAATAANVFHVPLNEVTKQQRRNAKAVNFGVVYGISAFGLSEDLTISRKEAQEYINNYFASFPKVKSFLDENVKLARKQGFVKTMFGRIRPIPEIRSSNFMQRSFGDRVAMNSPIQGTAADIMKIAMIAVDEALKKSGLDARIVLQVHDELLVEVKEDDAQVVQSMVEECMKNAAKLAVTLEVSAHIGKTWLEAK
ncbi:MAG: DNA polymerase I [Lachnospiraceae bacterium]|nr:DNA polymerase I [Lachnospiraceae bacterium]